MILWSETVPFFPGGSREQYFNVLGPLLSALLASNVPLFLTNPWSKRRLSAENGHEAVSFLNHSRFDAEGCWKVTQVVFVQHSLELSNILKSVVYRHTISCTI
jgi:hypothetical protein